MSSIGDLFAKLIGSAPVKPTEHPAPPLAAYPSSEDAAYARQYGFGYGTPTEAYVDGKAARVLGGPSAAGKSGAWPKATFAPRSAAGLSTSEVTTAPSANIDLAAPENADTASVLGDVLARAALAANRVPLAALGFDPSRATLDVKIQNPTIGGVYSPSKDATYAAVADPSALVHEAAHRGLHMLRQNPANAEMLKQVGATDEDIVRYVMARQAGDPEKGAGRISDQQRDLALNVFEKSFGAPQKRQALQGLEKAAQDAIAARRPRGPR